MMRKSGLILFFIANLIFNVTSVSWAKNAAYCETIHVLEIDDHALSKSKNELDKFCNALISIKKEISDSANTSDTPLKNAPHTALEIASKNWNKSYTREVAAYPTKYQKEHKYWPPVGRIDNAYGDRNLICTCPSVDDYKK